MPAVGIAVARWNPDLDVNPEELGIYQEGDLRDDPRNLLDTRNVIANPELAWPDARVPYEIHPDFCKPPLSIQPFFLTC